MHIQQIEIDNFKSFLGKTTIPMRVGFTTISGPNGSGKSNVIDCILFCLGLSTSRTMRAEKLPDLINHHTQRKDATVTITFNTDPDDLDLSNPEALNDPEAAKKLITVARRIKDGKSGYTSTYYLNGKTTTLSDVHETLAQYNVSPGCYNVMMQGDVASIVTMSALERRKIIDEIAGVAEFDRKIDQANAELKATGENIERNQILITEIDMRLDQLKEERGKALKYQKLKDDRGEAESLLKIARIRDLESAYDLTQTNLVECRQKKQTSKADIKTLEGKVQTTTQALKTIAEEVKRKGEDQQIAIKSQIESLKGHIARKEDVISRNQTEHEDNSAQLQRMAGDRIHIVEKLEAIQGEVDALNHQQKELEGLLQTASKDYEQLNHQFDAITGTTGEWSQERNAVKDELEVLLDEVAALNRRRLDLESEAERLNSMLGQQQQQYHTLQTQLSHLKTENTQLEETLGGLENQKAKLEVKLRTAQLDYNTLRQAAQRTQDTVNHLIKEFSQLEAKKQAHEEIHHSRAVETILRSDIKGVHGTLAQLLSVSSDYALAVEIAMGGRWQNIVVDNDDIAQQGIELLKRTNAGRATFLPMTKIRASKRLPSVPRATGVVDYLVNIITFEPRFDDIFHYALGDTLLVEYLGAARKLLGQHRMVTLDGSLLEKTGAMSGGAAPSSSRSRFATAAHSEQALQNVQDKLQEAEAEKKRLEKQLTQQEMQGEKLREEYETLIRELAQVSAQHQAVEKQIMEIESQLSTLKQAGSQFTTDDRLSAIEREALEASQTVTEKDKRIEVLKNQLDAIEAKIPADQLEQIKKLLSESKFQKDYYDSQYRGVETDLKAKALEKQYQEVGVKEIDEKTEKLTLRNQTILKENQSHQEEIQITWAQIQELDAQTKHLSEELKQLQAQRDEVQTQLIELEKQRNNLERHLAQLEEQEVSYQSRSRELKGEIQLAKREWILAQHLAPHVTKQLGEVVTRLTGEEDEEEPFDAEERDASATEEIDLDKLVETYEFVIPPDLPSEQSLTETIQKLSKAMMALEPVNMLAVKEYDDVTTRRTELVDKITTLSAECETLMGRITHFESDKRQSFITAFEQVDAHFKTIFAELSDGEGRLLLTQPDDPLSGGLTIEAQPRGKKMQRLESMSGGEKSLTSLAFVFSLQRYMPAPFYALDEVDMNLDGINVEKLAKLIQREAKSAQFLVVSLRKPMLENSDRTVGVTQKRNGISKITGMQHHHLLEVASDSLTPLIPEEAETAALNVA